MSRRVAGTSSSNLRDACDRLLQNSDDANGDLMKLLISSVTLVLAIVASDFPPMAFPVQPDPDECTQSPVTIESLKARLPYSMNATPASGAQVGGAPADGEVVVQVERAIHELFSCLNAGEPLRAFALYSEAYLQRILASETAESLNRLATPRPLDRDDWTIIVDIRNVRILDDGRVSATVILDPALIPVEKIFGFFLIREGDQWLIDDVLDELRFSLP